MRYDSPLRKRHQQWAEAQSAVMSERVDSAERPGAANAARAGSFEVSYVPYGPADEEGAASCEVIESFGPLESEYAVIRRSAGLFDAPHRGVIELRGPDRLDFLDRMITQAVGSLPEGEVCRSFWLDRKGRIVSDMLLGNLSDRTILELDIHAAARTLETLDAFLFAEDVQMSFDPGETAQLCLHGSATLAVLSDLLEGGDSNILAAASEGVLAGCELSMLRCDETGEPGMVLSCARNDAERIWDALLSWESPSGHGVRPIGWSAYNTARIEAGTPLFNVDFGTDALPHETGVLHDRVNFKKGCYLGQEIVARIDSLGHPKQVLCALDIETDMLPIAGAQVFAALKAENDDSTQASGLFGPQVGWVTSSTLAPMLGAKPIAFAMLKFDYVEPGTNLLLAADGEQIKASVHDGLRFLPGESS